MNLNTIINLVTIMVTLVMGEITKKYTNFEKTVIPFQNIAIGVIVMLIEWAITKDINFAIGASGILAGGAYDVAHNFNKIIDAVKGYLNKEV